MKGSRQGIRQRRFSAALRAANAQHEQSAGVRGQPCGHRILNGSQDRGIGHAPTPNRYPARRKTGRNGRGDRNGRALPNKIGWRFVPFLFLCSIFNDLDRVNVGFVKLELLDDLVMSETAYGLGAGIFPRICCVRGA
ncbi:hypothetical protein [Sphingomonas sp.]|uniref:hypothetical protein n=1 Tax=Sphingomonas sp. TaxID=28214 RepID=UPI003B3B0B63